jgi:hypothetical protein
MAGRLLLSSPLVSSTYGVAFDDLQLGIVALEVVIVGQ